MTGRVEESGAFADRLAVLEARLTTVPDKPEETPLTTLRALWHCAAGTALSLPAATEQPLPALDPAQHATLDVLIARRLGGTPLAHLTERQRFCGLEMLAGPDALIPRRETELLAATSIALLREMTSSVDHPLVIDLCTGSGNVAFAIAHAVSGSRVHAADISPEATALAGRNATHLRLADRVTLHTSDLFAAFDDTEFHRRVDLISCNPPYISTARVASMATEISAHEPVLAFDGGALGISILNRVTRDAPRFLRPGGWLAIEVGLGQGAATARRLQKSGAYGTVREIADERGDTRVIAAQAVA
jgi:release factor glutamine methyltransferase